MLKFPAAVVLTALCLCSPSCERIQKRQKEKEALNDIRSSKNDMLDSMKMSEDGMTIDMEKVKQAQQTLSKSGDKIGGKLGEAIKVIAELQGNMNQQGQKCIDAADEVAGLFDLESFSKTRDYAGGIEKLKKLIAVNEETLTVFEAFRPDVKKRLDGMGFTGKDRVDFDRGFQKKWDKTYELVKVVRNADIELGKTGITLMEGLRDGDSQWHWNADKKMTSFQTDEQVEWYQALMKKVEELGKTQSKAQQDLVLHLKQR